MTLLKSLRHAQGHRGRKRRRRPGLWPAVLKEARQVPFEIMEKCRQAIDLMDGFAKMGKRHRPVGRRIGVAFCKAGTAGASPTCSSTPNPWPTGPMPKRSTKSQRHADCPHRPAGCYILQVGAGAAAIGGHFLWQPSSSGTADRRPKPTPLTENQRFLKESIPPTPSHGAGGGSGGRHPRKGAIKRPARRSASG